MSRPDREAATVSERLAAFGIVHDTNNDGRRYIRSPSGPLGLMSAEEACNLLDILEQTK